MRKYGSKSKVCLDQNTLIPIINNLICLVGEQAT